MSYMGDGKPKLNKIFLVSRSYSQLLRLWVKKFAVKSPVPFMDSSFFLWSFQVIRRRKIIWKIKDFAFHSSQPKIRVLSSVQVSVMQRLGRTKSLLLSPAKTLILGSIFSSVSRRLFRAICSMSFPISEERVPMKYYWAFSMIRVQVIVCISLFPEQAFSSVGLSLSF